MKRRKLAVLLLLLLPLLAACGAPKAPAERPPDMQAPETQAVTTPDATQALPKETPQVTEAPDYAGQVANSFMLYWSQADYASMVSLCSMTWTARMDSEQALAAMMELLEDRIAVAYEVTRITGTVNDIRRDVYIEADISKGGGQIQRYQFRLKLIHENDFWYVDPSGLKSYQGTPTPTTRSAEITQPPTPAPIADPNTKLYYNPDGGSRYHLDPNCRSANERHLPFKGVFTYAELNKPEYADLVPCQICGAPLRPKE